HLLLSLPIWQSRHHLHRRLRWADPPTLRSSGFRFRSFRVGARSLSAFAGACLASTGNHWMTFNKSLWTSYGVMTVFVLLWGSAAIFTRWGLDHGTPFALLIVRFALALGAVLLIGLYRRRWRPAPGAGWQTAATGLLLIGCYSICYFQAMAHGVTPGVIATLLGVQPILTLLLLERRFSPLRLLGLLVALAGLAAVVFQSLVLARFSLAGMLFALGALLCMTVGAILQ